MKKLLLVLSFLTFCLPTYSQSPADLAKLAQGMKLDKSQVSGMIDMMVKMGKISKEDADKAKKELTKYSDEDMNALQHQAVTKLKSSSGNSATAIMPTQGQALSATDPSKEPASTDSASDSDSAAGADQKNKEADYKGALDYLNQ